MKHLAPCLLIAGLMMGVAPVASADAFDDAMQVGDDAFAEQDRHYAAELKSQDQAWQHYSEEINRAWARYSAEIDAVWGAAHAKKPTQTEWVAYSQKRDERSSIDFEKGILRIEVLLKLGESPQSPQVKKHIQQRLEQMVAQPAREDKALEVAIPPSLAAIGAPPKPIYPLSGQLVLSNGGAVTPSNAAQFATEAMNKQRFKTQAIQTPYGQKQVVSVSVPLVKGHVQKRARAYLQQVQEMARRFHIPTSLIFGIMQTESSFNPMAHNGVPAYGLMQLVPRSGARDAYQYVFHDDKLVSSQYLYNAANNIELGSAYLKLLQIREMKRIKDAKTRMLCAIAAYNTGGGNVARAFIPGSHNIRKASAIINRMSYEQVYEHLRAHLPYEETQRYVWKVRKYMKNYTHLDGV